ncbi:hypothetical protein OMK64_01755 [Cellulomonas fimi]|uniref:hypothetical protein n=1 Tax=Cellulomonas fimi TaxID=1708 RepID=UPI00234CA9A6|nr:hypothetical protein [Cellulomonas fimi]MDC7120257.1 hypothetical protein [Cellulomonas fimi]
MSASEIIPITGLPSAVPDGHFGARERLDPYWGGLWNQGLRSAWTDHDGARTRARSGLRRPPKWMLDDAAEALDHLLNPRRGQPPRGSWLSFLAAVNEWRNLTVQQLACVTGSPALAKPDGAALRSLFAAGLIDSGGMVDPIALGPVDASVRMVKPSRTDAFAKKVAPNLTLPELVQVTGGVGWKSGGTYDRHDLLVSELALRVAEFCEVGTVLGEIHSSVGLLTASSVGPGVQDGLGKAADACIVRADGMRIAIEMTASTGANFAKKVTRWAKILAETPWDLSGLMVVFVIAPPAGSHSAPMASTRQEISEAIRLYPGSAQDWIPERMGLVDWRTWFPAEGTVSRGFLDLTVERPTGDDGDRWQRVGLLDIFDVPFEPYERHDATAVLRNAPWLLGTPHWLRDGVEPHPDLWRLPVGRTVESAVAPRRYRPIRR